MRTIPDILLKHVSPLSWEHINLTGIYSWDTEQQMPEGFGHCDFLESSALHDVPAPFGLSVRFRAALVLTPERHAECAYVLAKGRPPLPAEPLVDVQGWVYTGNTYHPTQKPVFNLKLLHIETYCREGSGSWTPSPVPDRPWWPPRNAAGTTSVSETEENYVRVARRRLAQTTGR